jgi:predicted 3-demethylubiquinone-9 3-methyltransferase (glyoxalase superfamily)
MPDTITPCLWFDTQGEEAAEHYISIFPNSRITDVQRYNDAGPREADTVMVVAFELNGRPFVALNGGPQFTFNEAVSFQVPCDSQEEADRIYDALVAGGKPSQCGWLADKFGVAWQVFPKRMIELLSDPATAKPAMAAMMKMQRIDLAAIEAAAAGAPA